MLDDRRRLIAITHVPTNGGLVNPAAASARVARAAGVPYLLDACQSVGQMPVDVERDRLRLPVGHRPQVPARPARHRLPLRARERARAARPADARPRAAPSGSRATRTSCGPTRGGSRPGRRRYALRLGLGAAIDYALDVGVDAIWAARLGLASALRDGLGAIPGVALHDLGRTRCGIVSFSVDGVAPSAVKQRLAERRSTSSCPRSKTRASTSRIAASTRFVRASVHYYNTEDEIRRLVDAVGRP